MEIIVIVFVVFLFMIGVIINKNTKKPIPITSRKDVGCVGICDKKLYHTPNGTKHEFDITYEVEVIAL